jgi:hypothetical protein
MILEFETPCTNILSSFMLLSTISGSYLSCKATIFIWLVFFIGFWESVTRGIECLVGCAYFLIAGTIDYSFIPTTGMSSSIGIKPDLRISLEIRFSSILEGCPLWPHAN